MKDLQLHCCPITRKKAPKLQSHHCSRDGAPSDGMVEERRRPPCPKTYIYMCMSHHPSPLTQGGQTYVADGGSRSPSMFTNSSGSTRAHGSKSRGPRAAHSVGSSSTCGKFRRNSLVVLCVAMRNTWYTHKQNDRRAATLTRKPQPIRE